MIAYPCHLVYNDSRHEYVFACLENTFQKKVFFVIRYVFAQRLWEQKIQEVDLGMSTKFVYIFSEGNGKMRELLGGKGANLAEMTTLGMPVPQGFTITTEACTQYYKDGEMINADIEKEIFEYVVAPGLRCPA